MERIHSLRRRIRETRRCSAEGFALWAGSIFFCFLLVHFLGLREYTSILSGTMPQGTSSQFIGGFLALLYILFYLGAVVLSPIFAIASVVFFGLETKFDAEQIEGAQESKLTETIITD